MRYRKTISLSVLALVAGFGPGLAQTSLESVESQGSVVIDEHGYCRNVINSGPLAIAVPTRTAEEWSNGAASFVQNVSNMSGVSLEECGGGDNGITNECTPVSNAYAPPEQFLDAACNGTLTITEEKTEYGFVTGHSVLCSGSVDALEPVTMWMQEKDTRCSTDTRTLIYDQSPFVLEEYEDGSTKIHMPEPVFNSCSDDSFSTSASPMSETVNNRTYTRGTYKTGNFRWMSGTDSNLLDATDKFAWGASNACRQSGQLAFTTCRYWSTGLFNRMYNDRYRTCDAPGLDYGFGSVDYNDPVLNTSNIPESWERKTARLNHVDMDCSIGYRQNLDDAWGTVNLVNGIKGNNGGSGTVNGWLAEDVAVDMPNSYELDLSWENTSVEWYSLSSVEPGPPADWTVKQMPTPPKSGSQTIGSARASTIKSNTQQVDKYGYAFCVPKTAGVPKPFPSQNDTTDHYDTWADMTSITVAGLSGTGTLDIKPQMAGSELTLPGSSYWDLMRVRKNGGSWLTANQLYPNGLSVVNGDVVDVQMQVIHPNDHDLLPGDSDGLTDWEFWMPLYDSSFGEGYWNNNQGHIYVVRILPDPTSAGRDYYALATYQLSMSCTRKECNEAAAPNNAGVAGAPCTDARITWSGTSNSSYANGSCQAYALSNETSCSKSAAHGEVVHLQHSGKDDDRGWAYAQCIDGEWTVADSDCRDLDNGSKNEPWYGGEKDLLKYCQSGSGIQHPSYYYTSSYQQSVRSAINKLKAEGAVQSVGVEN